MEQRVPAETTEPNALAEKLKAEIYDKNRELERLRREIESDSYWNRKTQADAAEIERLRQENSTLTSRLGEVETVNVALQKQLDEVSDSFSAEETQMRRKLSALHLRHENSVNASRRERDEFLERIVEFRTELAESNGERKELKSQNERLKEHLRVYKRTMEELRQQLTTANEEIGSLRNAVREYSESSEEKTSLSDQLSDLQLQLSVKEDKLDKLSKQIIRVRSAFNQCREDNEGLGRSLMEAQQEKDMLNMRLKSLTEEVDRIRRGGEDTKVLMDEMKRMRKSSTRVSEENKHLRSLLVQKEVETSAAIRDGREIQDKLDRSYERIKRLEKILDEVYASEALVPLLNAYPRMLPAIASIPRQHNVLTLSDSASMKGIK